MSKKKIVISADDHRRLIAMLEENETHAMGDPRSIALLKRELERATVVASQQTPSDVVTMHSTVRLRDMKDREEDTYTLVYPREANLVQGKLSILAPIGTALLGYRVGDIVRWEVPGGQARIRIEELTYQPQRDLAVA